MMKKISVFKLLCIFFLLTVCCFSQSTWAIPVMNITGNPAFPSTVAAGETVSATYQITNQFNYPLTHISFTFPQPITRDSSSTCTNNMTLTQGDSCNLVLNLSTSQAGTINGSLQASSSGIYNVTKPIRILITPSNTSQWQFISAGIPLTTALSQFKSFSVNPINQQIVYVGSDATGRVFKSTDGGLTWTNKSTGLSAAIIWKIQVDPVNPDIVYATTNTGVYKSLNAGELWSPVNNGLPIGTVDSIALDPNNHNTLYAGSFNNGVYKSTDGGATWQNTSNNLPANFTAYTITFKPGDSNTIFVGSDRVSGGPAGAIFKSSNAGLTWTQSDSGIPSTFARIYKMLINPSNPTVCYAATRSEGGYKSTDGCSTWSKMTTLAPAYGLDRVYDFNFEPTNNANLIASTYGQVFRTTDEGANWNDINGTLDPDIFYTAIYSNSTLLQGTLNGTIYRTTDNGATWTLSTNGIVEKSITEIYSILSNHNLIIASLYDVGIYKSNDAGTNWTNIVNPALTSSGLWEVIQSPSNPSVLFVAADGQGVFKTTDGGANWVAQNTGLSTPYNFQAFVMDPNSEQKLFVSNYNSSGGVTGGLFESTDGGATWSSIPFFALNSVESIVINKNNSLIVYAANSTNDTIAKSTDGGTTWSTVFSPGTSSFTPFLSIDPNNTNVIYLAVGQSVYKSLNDGVTWSNYTLSTSGLTVTTTIFVDPRNSENLYVGTDRGVYHSINGGVTWAANNNNLTDLYVLSLRFEQSLNLLYAGTDKQGIFSLAI